MADPDKPALYRDLAAQLRSLIEGEPDRVANAANMAALLYNGLPDLNWAGFYFAQGPELVLGPFQGQPACVRIAWGPVSHSELVVPLIEKGRVTGVLDLDSPRLARFDDADRAGCETLVAV